MESNPINADNKENIENSDNNLQYGAIDFVLKHQMWLILFAILIIAFAFRFWGAMQWGHGLVYHPDEVGFVRIVFEGIKFGNFFDHPQLYASILRGLFGSNVPTGAASLQSMYAAGRMFGIMMSLITVVAVFFIGKKVHSKKAGYIAAFLLAITPIHIWHSHYMYNDIPVLAGIALTLLFSLYIIDNANFKWYILAGLSAVFAMGMKHTGWIALLVLILAHVLHHFYKSKGHEKRLKFFLKSVFDMNIFIAIGVVLVIYFITNLSFFANFAQFYAYMTQYTSGYTAVSGNVPFNSPYIFKILATFPFSMGILLYLAVLPGFFYAFKKRSKYDILLLAFFLAYFLYVGGWAKPYIRLMLPIIPVFLILGARFFAEKKSKLWNILLAIVIVYTLIFAISTTARYTNDTRDVAADWIYKNIPEGARIGNDPEFYSPKISSEFYEIIPWIKLDTDWLNENEPEFIIFTSEHDDWKIYTKEYQDFRKGDMGYTLIKTFRSNFFNQDFYTSLSRTFEGYPVSPTIEIYKKS